MSDRGHDARRFRVLRILMLAAGLVLAGRIVHIQVFEHEKYRAKALQQWERLIPIKAERGNLYDRHGQPLALSVTTWRIGVSGSQIDDTGSLAVVLSEVLKGDRARIRKKISGAGIPYRVPEGDELPPRLGAVCRVVYLVFNEGYAATEGDELIRRELCDEAIRLAERAAELSQRRDLTVLDTLSLTYASAGRRKKAIAAAEEALALAEMQKAEAFAEQIRARLESWR